MTKIVWYTSQEISMLSELELCAQSSWRAALHLVSSAQPVRAAISVPWTPAERQVHQRLQSPRAGSVGSKPTQLPDLQLTDSAPVVFFYSTAHKVFFLCKCVQEVFLTRTLWQPLCCGKEFCSLTVCCLR